MTTPRLCAPALALTTLLTGTAAVCQAPLLPSTGHTETNTERFERYRNVPLTTFHLKYATGANDANEILTAIRLMLDPGVKIYLDTRENAILLRGLPEEVAMATTMINQLDRPHATYRLTFTLTDLDGPRKLSSRDYTMTLLDGQRMTLKQGSRIPVVTGKYESGSNTETQMSYVDVGVNLDATVNSNETGAVLRQKVEQSSLPDTLPPGTTDPTIHQTVMEGVEGLTLGRLTPLGSLDAVGSTRHTEVEVKLEKLP